MRTADDYVEVSPGRWVLRDRLATSINPSTPRPELVDGIPRPRLIWAKDIKLECAQGEPNLWGDFLWPGSIHLLSGEPGAGKTTVLYNLAIKACRGEPFVGLPFTRLIRCLYLDLETPHTLRARKLHLISEGKPPDGLGFISSADLEKDMPWLTEVVKEFGFNLIIVDTINEAFSTADEDCNSEANRQMALTRRLVEDTGASVLLVQHIGKGESTKKVFKARGASARPASADVVLNLEATSDEVIRLEMVKNRWVGGISKLFLKKVGEDLFEPTEVPGEESVSAKIKAQTFIIQLLERSGKTLSTAEIKAEAQSQGFASATFERALSELVQVGKVRREVRGLYTLTEASKETSITSPLGCDVIDGKNVNEWVTERI